MKINHDTATIVLVLVCLPILIGLYHCWRFRKRIRLIDWVSMAVGCAFSPFSYALNFPFAVAKFCKRYLWGVALRHDTAALTHQDVYVENSLAQHAPITLSEEWKFWNSWCYQKNRNNIKIVPKVNVARDD